MTANAEMPCGVATAAMVSVWSSMGEKGYFTKLHKERQRGTKKASPQAVAYFLVTMSSGIFTLCLTASRVVPKMRSFRKR